HDGFEIQLVVSNHEVESFPRRIREKLLEFDLDVDLDGVEAAHALGNGDGVDVAGGEHALVEALEAQVDVQLLAGRNRRGALAQLLGQDDVELALPHLTGTVDEVANVHDEGRGRHDRRFYAASPVGARPQRAASASSRIA